MSRVLVVGAGMAGLAAARKLADAGLDPLVIEARNRLGGRAWTDTEFAGIPVELGGEYIHGDRVVTWEYVESLGLRTMRWAKQDDSMVRTEAGEWLSMTEARRRYPDFDATRDMALPDIPALPFEDLASYLRRVGYSREQLRYVERSYANAKSETMRFLSASSVLRGRRRQHENGDGDFRIVEGYGRVAEHLAEGLDVRFGEPVDSIDIGASRISLQTAKGEEFEAESLILAVPVGVLQSGSIEFRPGLPPEKLRALSGVRMGPVIKMVYRFREPVTPPEIAAIYSSRNPPMWWSPSHGLGTRGIETIGLQTTGSKATGLPTTGSDATGREATAHQATGSKATGSKATGLQATGSRATGSGEVGQVWSAFVSGSWATSLLALGEEGALAAGLESLSAELGRPLEPQASMLVNWPEDPFSRGGYSFVLPGHDGARELLAAPAPPLFFAGEATAPEHQSATVHGAIESGRRAAAEVLSFLDEADRPRSAVGR